MPDPVLRAICMNDFEIYTIYIFLELCYKNFDSAHDVLQQNAFLCVLNTT